MKNDYLYLVKFGVKEHLQQLSDGYMFFNIVQNFKNIIFDFF